jgi:hypothetical protein
MRLDPSRRIFKNMPSEKGSIGTVVKLSAPILS